MLAISRQAACEQGQCLAWGNISQQRQSRCLNDRGAIAGSRSFKPNDRRIARAHPGRSRDRGGIWSR